MTTLKQFHWFWAWDDEKEEAWLGEMARKGWHFKSVMVPGFYTFESGEPRNDVYRLDFFTNYRAKADYVQLFMDAGWDYMGEMGSWQYFRIEANQGDNPEIYSDNNSKMIKYRRIITVLLIFNPIYIVLLSRRSPDDGWFELILTIVLLLIEFVYIYAFIKLIQRIRQLQRIRE